MGDLIEIPTEVPLPRSPLIRVVSQIRFPMITSIEDAQFIGRFQEAIRAKYPVLRQERTASIVIGGGGPSASRQTVLWRFSDTSGKWRVTLSSEFLAVETQAYVSRDDFLDQASYLFAALKRCFSIETIDRIGIRYIDRVVDPELQDICQLVRREVLGILSSPLAANVHRSLSECLMTHESGASIQARWGRLPPHVTIDPSAIEAIDEQSWILDIDMYRAETMSFDHEVIIAELRGYCETIYAFFRWVVTDSFLTTYGGEIE
jgi:uncharacterized protein (TIGR04255 family)